MTAHLVLAVACALLGAPAAVVFCLRAVTVCGFVAGAAAAALVLLERWPLWPVLAGAALLACVCGVAPAWSRTEAVLAARAAGLPASSGVSRGRALGWRTDRVVAAALVLAYPPAVTVASVAFVSWTTHR